MMRFQPKCPLAIWMIKYFKYSDVSNRTGIPPSPDDMRTGIPHSSFK